MKFLFAVEVEVKNDAGTREVDPHDLAMMVQQNLESNKLKTLPWVIQQHYRHINGHGQDPS